jgi:DNA-binding CsgD family transcriptional regulator
MTTTQAPELSEREIQLLDLLAKDLTADQICAEMGVSRSTIKTYKNRMHAKLGVKTNVGAVVAGFRLGLLE